MKYFFSIFLLIFFSGCKSIFENYEGATRNYYANRPSDSGIYLSANYFLSKGDAYTANKILDTEIRDLTLLKLKILSNLISGNFEKIGKIKNPNENDEYLQLLFNISNFAIKISKNEIKSGLKIAKLNKNFPGFDQIIPMMELWLSLEEGTKKPKIKFSEKEELQIYKLMILENFLGTKPLKNLAKISFEQQKLSNIEALFLAGFFFRLNEINNFEMVIKKKLSDQFDKNFLIKNFSSPNNIFYKKPNFQTILALHLFNIATLNKKQDEQTRASIKILLEISLYICSEMDISKYSLAELYDVENSKKIALEKLNLINDNSFFSLARDLKKLSIFESLKLKDRYKNQLIRTSTKWPKNKFVMLRLAKFYKQQKKYEKSLIIYKEIIATHGEDKNLLFLYAAILDKTDNWPQSKQLFLKLLEKYPDDKYTLNYLSYKLALKNEDLDFALDLIKRALSVDPNNGFFLDTLGWVEYKRKNYLEAIFYLEKAIMLLPKNAEIINHLGDCYYKLGRTKEAIFEWQKALKQEVDVEAINSIKKKLNNYE